MVRKFNRVVGAVRLTQLRSEVHVCEKRGFFSREFMKATEEDRFARGEVTPGEKCYSHEEISGTRQLSDSYVRGVDAHLTAAQLMCQTTYCDKPNDVAVATFPVLFSSKAVSEQALAL